MTAESKGQAGCVLTPVARNQCDGCARGLPVENGIHHGPGSWDAQSCTADRYTRPTPAAAAAQTLQRRVEPWLLACFGAEIAADTEERNHRFLEESLELVQACGCTASEAHQLVDYVFGRPVGEKHQEAGGVMITLAALCRAQGIDMHEAGEVELARIWTMVEKIRAKQAAKPKHSPLPIAASPAAAAEPDEDEQLAVDRGADLLEHYAAFIRRVKSDEIEEHPYLPELEQIAKDLRALSKSMRAVSGAAAAAGVPTDRAKLAEEIKDAITQLSNGGTYPDLLDAVDLLASSPVAPAGAPPLTDEQIREVFEHHDAFNHWHGLAGKRIMEAARALLSHAALTSPGVPSAAPLSSQSVPDESAPPQTPVATVYVGLNKLEICWHEQMRDGEHQLFTRPTVTQGEIT